LPETFYPMRIATVLLLFLFNAGAAQTHEQRAELYYDYSSIYNSTSASLTKHNMGVGYTANRISLLADVSLYGIDNNGSGNEYASGLTRNITALSLSAGYTHALNSHWDATAAFSPKLVSDLKNTGMTDVYPGFFAGFTYKPSPEKTTRLTFGAGYNGYFGKYRFMPVVNYSGMLSHSAIFNLGIPASWVAYKLSDTHSLKALVTTDGVYSRISTTTDALYPVVNTTAAHLEMVTVNSGLEYVYHSGTEWAAVLRAGYSLYNKLTLPQETGSAGIGFNNNLYLSAGFKYNLNFK
jgi:hypothetical protein